MRVLAAALTTVAIIGAAAPAQAAGDEDRVRAVLDGMNGSYNRADFASFVAHVCTARRQADGFEAGWRWSRATDGPTRITVNSVTVAGGDAVANVRFTAHNRTDATTFDIDFHREDGEWKACEYHAARAV